MPNDCTILILTYKGKKHLEFLLPTVREAIENSPAFKIDVWIVDNGADKPTNEFVMIHFPEFEYKVSAENAYLFSLNKFVQEIQSEYVFILNDDMRMDKESLNQTIPILNKNKNLFSVTCKIMNWDGNEQTSFVRKMKYSKGWVYTYWDKTLMDDSVRYSLYGGGGAAVFRTQFYNELQGFDRLFYPAYCEDLDLGYRAWKQNRPTVYNPLAILFHREGGTITEQFKADDLEQKIKKNQIVWMLKNCRFPGFSFLFFLFLPYRFLWSFIKNRNSFHALRKALIHSFKSKILFTKCPDSRLKDSEIELFCGQEFRSLT